MYAETTKLRSLYVPKSAPWKDVFMREYLTFPGSKYKDQIDALSQFFNWRTEKQADVVFSYEFL
jgi:phage terminase large subunit-like protein